MRNKLLLGYVLALAVILGGFACYTQAARQNAPVYYFKIVPVDPRALLSGDYMALSFREEREFRYDKSLQRTVLLYADPNGAISLEKTDRPVAMQLHSGRLKLPHQFYFEEGTGAKYEGAAYAKMRRLPDGRFLIDALTDEKFNEIK